MPARIENMLFWVVPTFVVAVGIAIFGKGKGMR